MPRYIFENQYPAGTEGHAFVSWDELGGLATEATFATALGNRMPAHLEARFAELAPGQVVQLANGNRLFVES